MKSAIFPGIEKQTLKFEFSRFEEGWLNDKNLGEN